MPSKMPQYILVVVAYVFKNEPNATWIKSTYFQEDLPLSICISKAFNQHSKLNPFILITVIYYSICAWKPLKVSGKHWGRGNAYGQFFNKPYF